MSATVTTTAGFRAMAKDSEGRNRGPNARLLSLIDPNGTHVACLQMLHNDCELRVQWAVKLTGDPEAAMVWMDTSLECFNAHTAAHTAATETTQGGET
jgi:hypothetical protein